MIRHYRVLQHSARQAANAALGTLEALREQRIEQEPTFTDRMLGRIQQAMEGYAVNGVRWTAKTLTDHGPKTQEKKYGADFAGVLEIALPGFSVKKGFLAQAKLIRPNKPMDNGEFLRLQGQCSDMLNLSASSFVFVYTPESIIVVPAISVAGTQPRALHVESQECCNVFSRTLCLFHRRPPNKCY